MKNLPKNKRSKVVLVIMGTLVVTVGIWQAMVVTQQRSLILLNKNVDVQKRKNEDAQRLVSATAKITQDLEAATQKLKAAEGEMASGDMFAWMNDTLKKNSERYKVEIPQISREVPCPVGVFAKFPYRAVMFNVRGTAFYHHLGSFLADFENRFPYLRVQNLELEPAGGSTSQTATDPEKLAFRMEIVALVNPLSH